MEYLRILLSDWLPQRGGILRYLTTGRNPGKIFQKVNSFSLFGSFKKVRSENFIIYEFEL